VDLAQVAPTGAGGRLTEADIRAAAAPHNAAAPSAAPPERISLRGIRRAAAEHLAAAHRNTAPYTLVEEVDFTELVGLRERVRPLAEQTGARLTYLPFILTAVGMALREHPRLNAVVEAETGDLLIHPEQHLGVAVHTQEGLLVPVVRNVERRQLLELASEIERLTGEARAGTLPLEAVQGGTFTVSSLGSGGGLLGTPVLNTPQVAVLSVHRIGPRPVIYQGEIASRQIGNVCLTLDHRYVDGQDASRFLDTLKQALEDPAVMLFWLAELFNHRLRRFLRLGGRNNYRDAEDAELGRERKQGAKRIATPRDRRLRSFLSP
jgi:pyruvate dehydrogenase E2 component (dihydrolipoamide acetyltransferase)